jgi:lon-related putative ATP-dependent protease
MPARLLAPSELIKRCDAASLGPGVGATVGDDGAGIIGQQRARDAIEFGITMARPGHHMFVMGPRGAGKQTLVRRAIEARLARNGAKRFDWIYVNNFDEPHKPLALGLPPGRGVQLRQHMRELVDDLRTMIPAIFESEEYINAVERLNSEFKERAEQAVLAVGEDAQRHGLVMVRTPVGLSFAPRKGEGEGEVGVLSPQEFEALPQAERERLQQAMSAAQEQLARTLRSSMHLRKELADRLRALNRSMTLVAVEHAVDEIKSHYVDLPAVGAYLDAVRTDVIESAESFRTAKDDESSAAAGSGPDLSEYEVNVIVDAGGSDGAPIVTLDHPTFNNLVGRVDHIARLGALLTDYRLIKGGVLHRANGGYLLIDAAKLLVQPFAWDALKRALTRGEIRIESMAEQFSLVSTVQLEPAPIPLTIKVVLLGERELGELLQEYDPDFLRLFRVVADLSDDLPREPATQRALARAIAADAHAQALRPPTAAALARLIDHGARLAGDATRLTGQVQRLLDVVLEADHLAQAAGRDAIDDTDVAAAIAARRYRASRLHERLQQEVARDMLMIATSGSRVGQVNGLMVFEVGDQMFGEPVRISATTRLGEGEVIDIQRETQLGGPLHAKGVLILASYLASRYSRFHAHAIVASLVFEQTYSLVEGDSASLAELVALLSSIADVPVKQCFAITGSVNQFGDVQPIGGVNQKIEGFFDICAARGLDGTHGVIVPQANVAQLMLRDDVIEAVTAGRFAIHAVRHVDDAVEVLSGLAAGDPLAPQPDSVNGRIAARLHEYATLGRGEQRHFTRRRGAVSHHRHGGDDSGHDPGDQ